MNVIGGGVISGLRERELSPGAADIVASPLPSRKGVVGRDSAGDGKGAREGMAGAGEGSPEQSKGREGSTAWLPFYRIAATATPREPR